MWDGWDRSATRKPICFAEEELDGDTRALARPYAGRI